MLRRTLSRCRKSKDTRSLVHCFNKLRVMVTVNTVLRTTRLGVVVLMSKFVVAGYVLTTSRLCPRMLRCTVFNRRKSRTKRGLMLSTVKTGPLLGLNLHLKRKAKTVYSCPVVSSTMQVVGRVSGFTRTTVAGCFWWSLPVGVLTTFVFFAHLPF